MLHIELSNPSSPMELVQVIDEWAKSHPWVSILIQDSNLTVRTLAPEPQFELFTIKVTIIPKEGI